MKHIEILKKDKKLSILFTIVKPYEQRRFKDIYFHLLRSISAQQLSVKAAATIWQRFLNLFPDNYPHPRQVIDMDREKMRTAGLSYPKTGYMKNIAEFSMANDISYEYLSGLEDDRIIEYLGTIKGVGRWTIEMLLMFTLGRNDVFPVDDVGIVNAMKHLYGLKEEGKALKLACIDIADKWKPYRSHACFYLWPYKDTIPFSGS